MGQLDLLPLKRLKRPLAGEFQAGDVLLDCPIDVLYIDAQVVVHQDIPESCQPFPIDRRVRCPDAFAQT